MRYLLLIFLVTAILPAARAEDQAPAGFSLDPVFDLRIRQEILDGVYHFAPDPYRNWIRLRTRLGAAGTSTHHDLKILLTNEHRRFVGPGRPVFDWDELILDQAFWKWKPAAGSALTVGRQDIIWEGGFLMLEGHPLDGSRSIYHHAVRFQTPWAGGDLDLALIHNPKRDPIVLAGDRDLPLTDADETALAARMARGTERWSVIWKDEVDPDGRLDHLQLLTLGGRTDRSFGAAGAWMVELALQYQKGRTGTSATADGFAFALQAHLQDDLGRRWTGRAGYFHYSGAGDDLRAFRTPWGRWPKWSELYIYTLIGESTPGRVHVAAWENIAAPHATVARPLGDHVDLRLAAYYLLAPQTDWAARGALTHVELEFDLLPGLDGHLLWEMLVPGDFHDGRGGLDPLTGTVHFLRWQVAYALK